jgi:diguanylate cyclase (GGDEF)-like protein
VTTEYDIDALWADIVDRDTMIDALRAELCCRDTMIDALRAELCCRDTMIDALRAELCCRDLDELTGMYNLRWLREFWSGLDRPADTIGAVAFLDVDLLKRVNDTHGHKVGDRVITHVAAVLMSSGCYGIRYGGDEFLVLVPAGWDIGATLNNIINDVAARPVPTRDDPIRVIVSCGARVVSDGADLHDLIKDADDAMYEVKRERSGSAGCRVIT